MKVTRTLGSLPGGDDVPDRPKRLNLVASGLRRVLGRQVGREVVKRPTVQGDLEHTMVAEGPELAGDPTLLADAVARAHRRRRPEAPAVGLSVCRLLANDVPGGLTLERVDRVSRRALSDGLSRVHGLHPELLRGRIRDVHACPDLHRCGSRG